VSSHEPACFSAVALPRADAWGRSLEADGGSQGEGGDTTIAAVARVGQARGRRRQRHPRWPEDPFEPPPAIDLQRRGARRLEVGDDSALARPRLIKRTSGSIRASDLGRTGVLTASLKLCTTAASLVFGRREPACHSGDQGNAVRRSRVGQHDPVTTTPFGRARGIARRRCGARRARRHSQRSGAAARGGVPLRGNSLDDSFPTERSQTADAFRAALIFPGLVAGGATTGAAWPQGDLDLVPCRARFA
jgi:hypothetical protein